MEMRGVSMFVYVQSQGLKLDDDEFSWSNRHHYIAKMVFSPLFARKTA